MVRCLSQAGFRARLLLIKAQGTIFEPNDLIMQAVEPSPCLPKTCKRLVARHTGSSFAAVAEVQEIPLPEPGPGEVNMQDYRSVMRVLARAVPPSCCATCLAPAFAHTIACIIQVLVRVHYAGINGGCETFRARGEHSFSGNQDKANFPLGAEGCGVVVALGPGVRNLQVRQADDASSTAAVQQH